MKLDYKIHSVTRNRSAVIVTHKGKDVQAEVDVLTVELVSDDNDPVITLRLDDPDEAEKLFTKPGKKITLTFAGAK